MRSTEVEQDILLEGRNKYNGGYGEKSDSRTNADTNGACLFWEKQMFQQHRFLLRFSNRCW